MVLEYDPAEQLAQDELVFDPEETKNVPARQEMHPDALTED